MKSGDWRELEVTESTTGADGKYTFTIPPDQLRQRLLYIILDLRHPEYAPRHCGSYSYGMTQKNLELGSEPWFAELKMVRGSKISGRLIDENGKPFGGAQLRGRSEDPSVDDFEDSRGVEAVSDEEGRFEVQVTRDGTAGLSIVPLQEGENRRERHGGVVQASFPALLRVFRVSVVFLFHPKVRRSTTPLQDTGSRVSDSAGPNGLISPDALARRFTDGAGTDARRLDRFCDRFGCAVNSDRAALTRFGLAAAEPRDRDPRVLTLGLLIPWSEV